MGHPEPLFLVDDAEAQVLELHVLLDQLVGAHHHVDGAILQLFQDLPLLLWGAEPAEKLHRNGVALQPPEKGLVMLPGQDGGGDHNGALLAVQDALKDPPKGHLGLAEAHVPAEEAVHGAGALHIRLDLGDAPQLVVGLVVLKPLFKLPLPVAVRGEGVALGGKALGVKLDQLLGHVRNGLLHPLAGLVPHVGMELIQAEIGPFPAADVLGHLVQLGDGDKEGVGPGVTDFDIVLGHPLDLFLKDPLKDADAVGCVDHIVPRGQVGDVQDGPSLPLGGAGPLFPPQGLGGPAVSDPRQTVAGVLKAGGKAPLADKDLPGGKLPGLGQVPGWNAVAAKVGYQGQGTPAGAVKDIDAVALP